MANVRLIRRRIKSAKNIAQITKAMELVAASKMKKAQAQALSGKLYAQKIYAMVMRLSAKLDISTHPLLQKPPKPMGTKLVILLSTNKGLCGSLNTNLFRFMLRTLGDFAQYRFVTLGKKGARFIAQTGGVVAADFSHTSPFSVHASALNDLVTSDYTSGKYDSVEIVFSEFFSALKQIPRRKTILPLTIELASESSDSVKQIDYRIEPSDEDVFNALLPHYIENQIRDAILQAEASEHSARMVAMRNATDNAKSLVYELSLLYNKARQEKITYEISDMVTARLAVEP